MTGPEPEGFWAGWMRRMNEPHPLLPEVTQGAVLWWCSIAAGAGLMLLAHAVSDITSVFTG